MSDAPAHTATPDLVRRLGFEGVLRLPQFDFSGAASSALQPLDVEGAMQGLTPEQRERVFNVATRRLAFQMLYQLEAAGVGGAGGDVAVIVRDELARVADLGPIAAEKAAVLILGAWAKRAQADADFTALAPQWPAHRQAGVDRAILRVVHYEITLGMTPARIAINEAVELARAFSTEKSPAFVNALLDKVAAKAALNAPQNAPQPGTGAA
jgi:N utilization substance protein B